MSLRHTRPRPTSIHNEPVDDDAGSRPTLDLRMRSGHPTPPPSTSPLPTFERYEIIGELGRGGMGVVFKAIDRDLKRPVAIKMILQGNLAAFDALTRFKAETEAIGRLDHPNLVRIYETGHVDGRPFAVMEFIEGGTLADHIAYRRFTPQEAARIIADLADAVDSAHQSGVIHRDLKPANILLRGEQPKVVDFGLAKLEGAVDCTQTGDVIGTPNYMAPERVTGPKTAIGGGVDIYALGAILFEMLTKHPPFEGSTPVEVLRLVVDQEPPSVRSLRPDVARDVDTICRKCLQKKPHQRYASAKELADDLRRYLRGEPIKARPISTGERLGRWAKRHPTIAVALVLLFAVWTGVAVASTLAAQSYRTLADNEKAAKELAESSEREARWNAYRGHMAAVASHLQLNNYGTAKTMLDAAPKEHHRWEWHYFNAQMDLSEHPSLRFPQVLEEATYSNDGQTLLLKNNGRLSLLDDQTRTIRAQLVTGDWPVRHAVWSPDNRQISLGFTEGRVGVYDVTQRTWRAFPTPKAKGIGLTAWAPDGRYLLCTPMGENKAVVVDLLTERLIPLPHDEEIFRAHVLGDSVTALIVTHKAMYWWSIPDGKLLTRLATTHGAYDRWSFSPDRRYLASSYFYPDLAVRVWDVVERRLRTTLDGHTNSVQTMAFTTDNRRLVTAGQDQSVRVWNLADSRELHRMEGHTQTVGAVAITPDDRTIISGSEDGTLRLWDSATGKLQTALHGQAEPIYKVILHPNGNRVIAKASEGLRWFNIDTIRKRTLLGKHDKYAYGLALAPDGRTVASCGWDDHVRLWDLVTGQPLESYTHQKLILAAVAFHPTRNEVAVIERDAQAKDGSVYRWQRSSRTPIRHHQEMGTWRIDTNPAYSPDGQWLAAGGPEGYCNAWPTNGGSPQKYLLDTKQDNRPRTGSVAWSPDGTELAGVTETGEVVIWKRGETYPVRRWQAHQDVINSIQYSPDGRQLFTTSLDFAVHIWDAATGERRAQLRHGSKVWYTALHPTEPRLATACADGSIRLWDTNRYQEVAELRGHTSYVKSLLFTPDGERLLSASGDGTIRIWDKRPLRRE